MTVRWTAPVAELTITGYELQWRSSSDTNWTAEPAIASSATSYTITGLQPQTTYEVQVRAAFATIAGAWSESITVSTTAPASAPTAPPPSNRPVLSELTADANDITVSWTAPATGESITGYELQWRFYSLSKWTTVTGIASTENSYTITGLQPQTTYEVQVRAAFATTAGTWSESITVSTTAPASAPTAPPPSNLPALSELTADANSITVSWTAPATGESITGYELQWRLYILSKWTTVTGIASSENSYTITGLQPGVYYDVRVRALHGSDEGRWSAAMSCATRKDDSGPPFASFYIVDRGGPNRMPEAGRYSLSVVVFYPSPEYFPMTIRYRLSETGDMLHSTGAHTTTIAELGSGAIHVPLVDDDVDEPDSIVTATILPGTGYRVGLLSSHSFTVTDDDDPPSLEVDDVTVTEGDSGMVNATFTVSLDAASGRTVTVDWATSDGTATAEADYTAGSGTLIFAPGETEKTFDVAVTGDTADEDDETYTVTLSNAGNARIPDATGTGTITDDD